jgi:GH18 family chitinase
VKRQEILQQLANTVNTYGLDGIDFDDEYSEYGNNGTGQPNDSSFVMLVQELRALLPDKIISFIIMVMPLQGFPGTEPE